MEHLIVHIRERHCMGCDWLLAKRVEVILYIHISNPSAQAGYDKNSIFFLLD